MAKLETVDANTTKLTIALRVADKLTHTFLSTGIVKDRQVICPPVLSELHAYFRAKKQTNLLQSSLTDDMVLALLHDSASRGNPKCIGEAWQHGIVPHREFLDVLLVFAVHRSISKTILAFDSEVAKLKGKEASWNDLRETRWSFEKRLSDSADTYRNLSTNFYFTYGKPWEKTRERLTFQLSTHSARLTRSVQASEVEA